MEPYPCRYGRPERRLGRIRRPTKPKTSKFRHDSLPAPLNAQVVEFPHGLQELYAISVWPHPHSRSARHGRRAPPCGRPWSL
jgi:hypothetical protein